MDTKGKIDTKPVGKQTHQAIENIRHLLLKGGGRFSACGQGNALSEKHSGLCSGLQNLFGIFP